MSNVCRSPRFGNDFVVIFLVSDVGSCFGIFSFCGILSTFGHDVCIATSQVCLRGMASIVESESCMRCKLTVVFTMSLLSAAVGIDTLINVWLYLSTSFELTILLGAHCHMLLGLSTLQLGLWIELCLFAFHDA